MFGTSEGVASLRNHWLTCTMNLLCDILTFGDNIVVQALLAFPLLLSMVLSYRCLRVPDVTMDGSSIIAASLCVFLMRTAGVSLPVAILIGVVAGFSAGILTGILIELFKINGLLAGILNAFVFYSLGLILIGAAFDFQTGTTLFSWLKEQDHAFCAGFPNRLVIHPHVLGFLLGVALALKAAVNWFLRREWGVVLRGAGSNELFLQLRGVNTKRIRILGFGLSNALVGLGAILISMYDGSVQVMRWPGTIIFSLSVAIVGWEAARQLSSRFHVVLTDSAAIILGSILYFFIVRACYTFDIPTALPRLLIALYIVLVLAERKDSWRRIRELLR